MTGGGHCPCHANWDCGKRVPPIPSLDYLTRAGRRLSAGYLPGTETYSEIYALEGSVFVVVCKEWTLEISYYGPEDGTC